MNSPIYDNTAIIIPAFNEEDSIGSVIEHVMHYAVPIIVDDGSTDTTSQVASMLGATVIRHDINKGYDAALRTGINLALELGFNFAITLDADGQHDPSLIEKFMNELNKGSVLVVGVRDRFQRFSEVIFSTLGDVFWGIKDPLCGLKGYKLSEVDKIGLFDSYNSIGTECAIRLSMLGKKIVNIPIITKDRANSSRFGSGLLPNLRIMRSLFFGLWVTLTTSRFNLKHFG